MNKEKYIRFERQTRYHELRLCKDLFDDWVVTKINGSLTVNNLGKIRNDYKPTYDQAASRFEELVMIIKKKRYRCVLSKAS